MYNYSVGECYGGVRQAIPRNHLEIFSLQLDEQIDEKGEGFVFSFCDIVLLLGFVLILFTV